MESINKKIIEANIELLDENKVLKEDKKILQTRINKVIEFIKYYNYVKGYYEYLEDDTDEYNFGEDDLKEDLLIFLQGSDNNE